MKRFIHIIIGVLLAMVVTKCAWAELNRSNCIYNGEDIGSSDWEMYWQTMSASIPNGDSYYRYDAYFEIGYTYYISLCTDDGGSADFDTYLGVSPLDWDCYDDLDSDEQAAVVTNDDYCGTRSRIEYVATRNGWGSIYISGWSSNYGSFTMAYKRVETPVPSVAPDPYCTPTLTSSTTTYYISNFTTTHGTTNISNTTDGAGHAYFDFYDDFNVTSYPDSLIEFTITIAPGGSSTHGSAIWVDWNDDGTFSSEERMWHTTSYTASPHTGNFTVPIDAGIGEHRMRVVSDYLGSNPANPCSASTGEYEDYKFIVIEPSQPQPAETCESFEYTDIPSTWNAVGYNTYNWQIATSYNYGNIQPQDGEKLICIYPFTFDANQTYLISPAYDLTQTNEPTISFYYCNRIWGSDIDYVTLYYNTNDGAWQSIYSTTTNHEDWEFVSVTLPQQTGYTKFKFEVDGHYGRGVAFDYICIGGNMPLPIQLIYFNATARTDGTNILKWATGWEHDNSNFEIYRTNDILSNSWQHCVTLWQGMSDKPRGATYQWLDTNPYDTTYYMLLQNDLDGGFERFRSEYVVCIKQHKFVCIEPSVTCHGTTQAVGGSEPCEVYVQNVLGQLVEEFTLQPYQTHDISPNVSGAYLVTFVYEHNGQTYKLTEKVICM